MTTKYVDIIKKSSTGETQINRGLTGTDIENINRIGQAVKSAQSNISELQVRLESNINAVKNRMEQIYNNGIDDVQQRKIEALEAVDEEQLSKINETSDKIDELRSSGLKSYDADIEALQTRLTNVENETFKLKSEEINPDELIGLNEKIELNENNIDIIGTELKNLSLRATDIEAAAADDVNSLAEYVANKSKNAEDVIASVATDLDDYKVVNNSNINKIANRIYVVEQTPSYRVWSNGYCEVHDEFTINLNNGTGETVITFPKAFTGSYIISSLNQLSGITGEFAISDRNSTSLKISFKSNELVFLTDDKGSLSTDDVDTLMTGNDIESSSDTETSGTETESDTSTSNTNNNNIQSQIRVSYAVSGYVNVSDILNNTPDLDSDSSTPVSTNGRVFANVEGSYTIEDSKTYILTLKGNSVINIDIKLNTEAKLILKQTGSYTCTFTGCVMDSDPTISTAEGGIDVFEFTNYGKVRGYHTDQY